MRPDQYHHWEHETHHDQAFKFPFNKKHDQVAKKEADLTAQIELEKRKARELEQKRLALSKTHAGLRRVHPPHRAANDEDEEVLDYVVEVPDEHHHEGHYSDDHHYHEDHYETHHHKHHDKHHDKHHSHHYDMYEPLYIRDPDFGYPHEVYDTPQVYDEPEEDYHGHSLDEEAERAYHYYQDEEQRKPWTWKTE